MSNDLVNNMRSIKLPPIYKTVLWVLCDIASDKGDTHSYAPLSRLIDETCLSRNAVVKALNWLESVNLILGNRENGRKTTYKITLQNADMDLILAENTAKKEASKRELPPKPVRRVTSIENDTSAPCDIEPVRPVTLPVRPVTLPVHAAHTNHLIPLIPQEQPLKQRAKAPSEKPASSKFIPPQESEVKLYFSELGEIGGEDFYDHFKSNGWKVSGKTPMADWQAAARNWIRRGKKFQAAVKPKEDPNKWNFDDILPPTGTNMRTVNGDEHLFQGVTYEH